MKRIIFAVLFLFSSVTLGLAGEADVLEVRIDTTGDSAIQVRETVQHDDEGWQHYVDKWEILDMKGNILDTRILLHPHSHAPFTRSLPRAKIPNHVKKIRVRAHDSVHGYGGKEIIIEIP